MKKTREEHLAAQRASTRKYQATANGKATIRRLRQKHGAKNTRDHRARVRAELHRLKSVPCVDCGGTFDPVCMDFDHRPGEVKLFTVSQGITRSHAATLAEVRKCDVVCANCHRLRTLRQRDHRRASQRQPVLAVTETQLGLVLFQRVRQLEVRGLIALSGSQVMRGAGL